MSSRSFALDPAIEAYTASVNPTEHPILQKLRAETASMPNAQMQIGADQGQFIAFV
ncbi:MAG: hypothetical protein QOJ65_1978, partial [Fimbriimonadaceae bacterium]|nr:hypothetical protein [Fimbriimonadaceae bacterium]